MADTLTYTPTNAIDMTKTPRVLKAQFGEGYSQRVGDGLNNIAEVWNVTFQYHDVATRDALESFLATQGGVSYFLWTPPYESTAKRYICMSWQKTFSDDGIYGIQATFNQVFDI